MPIKRVKNFKMTNKKIVLVDTENLNELYTYEENLPIIELIDKLATILTKQQKDKDGSEYFEELARVCHIDTELKGGKLY